MARIVYTVTATYAARPVVEARVDLAGVAYDTSEDALAEQYAGDFAAAASSATGRGVVRIGRVLFPVSADDLPAVEVVIHERSSAGA